MATNSVLFSTMHTLERANDSSKTSMGWYDNPTHSRNYLVHQCFFLQNLYRPFLCCLTGTQMSDSDAVLDYISTNLSKEHFKMYELLGAFTVSSQKPDATVQSLDEIAHSRFFHVSYNRSQALLLERFRRHLSDVRGAQCTLDETLEPYFGEKRFTPMGELSMGDFAKKLFFSSYYPNLKAA
ncbi:MAG TPA: hypothetical protein VK158_00855 [Acidobacteriota bacterium]|nr:hypothetical protein [Acidobacteriota bacterium]